MNTRSKTVRDIDVHKHRMTKISRVFDPAYVTSRFFRALPGLSYLTRVHLDALPRANLAYGIYAAALHAKALGLKSVSAIEFGVGLGGGLFSMERHANALSKEIGIDIQVYGFDRCAGLAATDDIRDITFYFRPGYFRSDEAKIRDRLTTAKYIVGDIADTLPKFMAENPAPVGFVSIDVDYYTSTLDCFALFRGPAETRLPRVFAYLDDIFGTSDLIPMTDDIGELAATRQWNVENPDKKIRKIDGLRNKRPLPQRWNDQFYCLHDFTHPEYNKPISMVA